MTIAMPSPSSDVKNLIATCDECLERLKKDFNNEAATEDEKKKMKEIFNATRELKISLCNSLRKAFTVEEMMIRFSDEEITG